MVLDLKRGERVGKSLQDQLLKAGLVDEKRLQQANKAKQRQNKAERHGGQKTNDHAAQRAKQAMTEQATRDRELNRRKQEAVKRREIRAQVRQLIENNRLTDATGDIAYHFNDQGTIKRLYVTQEQQTQFGKGQLAIVKLKAKYDIVRPDIAAKIRQRDATCVVELSTKSSSDEADDAYAAYQVPDDLIW